MAEYQVVTEFVADTTGLKSAADQMLDLGQISKKQYEEFTRANQQAEQAAKRAIAVEQALGKATQQTAGDAKKMNDTFRQLTTVIAGEVLKEAVVQLAEVGSEIQQVETKAKTAKQELRELTNAINSGTLQGEALQTATERAAELTDQIGDARDTVQRLASDTRTFDLVAEGVRGITAAFSVAQAGAALFGKENEDLQRALLKVQAAMALATGAQELANIATTKGGIATKAYGAAVTVVEFIQKRFAISAAASWAVATGGVTVLIAGVAALISYLNGATNASEELARKEKKRKEDFGKQFAEQINAIDELDKIQENERKKAQIRGEDLVKLEKRQLNERLALITQLAQEVKYNHETNAIDDKTYKDLSVRLETERLDTLLALRKTHTEKATVLHRKDLEAELARWINADERLRKALIEQGDNTAQDADRRIQYYFLGGLTKEEIAQRLADTLSEADQKAADVLNSKQKAVGPEYFKDVWEQGKKASADYVESVKNDWAKLTEIINDENSSPYLVQLAQIERVKLENQILTDTMIQAAQYTADAIIQIRQQQIDKEFSQHINALESLRDKELEQEGITAEQKQNIQEKYQNQINALKKRQFEQEKKLKLADIATNTVLSISKLSTTTPPTINGVPNPAYYAALALLITQGVAQAATVSAQTYPAYAKGGKNIPAGMKLVGEEGPELIYTPGGETVIPNSDTQKILEKWSIPMPKVVDNMLLPVAAGNATAAIDYDRLSDAFASRLAKNPTLNVKIDKDGLSMHVVTKAKSVTLLNQRYEL